MGWALLGVAIVAYVVGAYSHARRLWPFPQLHKLLRGVPETPMGAYKFDKFGRLVGYPGKQEAPCPPQGIRTMVLLTIGQSNAANVGGQRYRSQHGERVLNYFDGKCYIASSPLLGTNGIAGESWTLLGNKLIEAGVADRVILVPSAIGSTLISRWREGGDLNRMLQGVLEGLPYRITHVLWHQGEDDFLAGTSAEDYARMFRSLVGSLKTDAPVFVCVATKAGINPAWSPDNPVARAQRSLPDGKRIFLGVDTDALMTPEDRFEDTHFAGSGQEKFAEEWVRILAQSTVGRIVGTSAYRPRHTTAECDIQTRR